MLLRTRFFALPGLADVRQVLSLLLTHLSLCLVSNLLFYCWCHFNYLGACVSGTLHGNWKAQKSIPYVQVDKTQSSFHKGFVSYIFRNPDCLSISFSMSEKEHGRRLERPRGSPQVMPRGICDVPERELAWMGLFSCSWHMFYSFRKILRGVRTPQLYTIVLQRSS